MSMCICGPSKTNDVNYYTQTIITKVEPVHNKVNQALRNCLNKHDVRNPGEPGFYYPIKVKQISEGGRYLSSRHQTVCVLSNSQEIWTALQLLILNLTVTQIELKYLITIETC